MTTPRVVHTAHDLTELVTTWKQSGDTIALVPTMGALHSGHLALVKQAAIECSRVVVSVFVNPLQFGPGEDFDRYPRGLEKDLEALAGLPVDAVFAPDVTDIYPDWPATEPTVFAGEVGMRYEGADRLGHFDGVLTVVSRLFDLVGCDVAVFGQKDAQQVFLVTQMAATKTPPVRISVVDTVRDHDGLALSSRNAYLSASEREEATVFSRALAQVAGGLEKKRLSSVTADDMETARRSAEAAIEGGARTLHYIDVVEADTFLPYRGGYAAGVVVIGACSVAGVRLIDAIRVTPVATVDD